jgi:hypothetical protein
MKRTPKSRGRSDRQNAVLDRTFGDLEVRDADDDLRVQITAADVRKGKRKDPSRCALAQACAREYGSTAAVFFKTCAYVDVVDEDGVRRVERFVLSSEARKLVEEFDRGQQVLSGGRLMVLKAPSRGRSLDHQLRQSRAHRRAIRRGEYTPKLASRGDARHAETEPRDVEVRSGKGQWQMIKAAA